MTGRIVTARHGRPDIDRSVWISGPGYRDWWARYDEAYLEAEERPPTFLTEYAAGAASLLSSHLPRAIDTARRASAGREPEQDPVFGEAHLPAPPVPLVRLQAKYWGVISRIFWLLGYAPGATEGHQACWRRVDLAADALIETAARGDVLLCSHGYINWMIDRRMRAKGWRRVARAGGNHYWSWRCYERP